MNNDELLSINEVSEILNLSTDEVGQLMDKGSIKAQHIDGKRMVWRTDIPQLGSSQNLQLDLATAAKYVGESEATLKEFLQKGWIQGSHHKGRFSFPFKELYQYLHFTKKLKP